MSWTIDPAHTTFGFSARYMGLSTVRGRFGTFMGEVDIDPGDLTRSRGRIEIDMASVDTGDETRDQHLRSADFFDVENHPTMVFESKAVTQKGGNVYRVVGDLTIRGVTREVEVEVEFAGEGVDPYGNRRLAGSLTGTIQRSEWGLKWNVALEAGGLLVSDKVKIEVDGQLVESKAAAEETARKEAQAG